MLEERAEELEMVITQQGHPLLKYTLVDCLGPNSRIEKGEE
jgi:hypothetical protein